MKQNIKENVEQLSGCASQVGTVPMRWNIEKKGQILWRNF